MSMYSNQTCQAPHGRCGCGADLRRELARALARERAVRRRRATVAVLALAVGLLAAAEGDRPGPRSVEPPARPSQLNPPLQVRLANRGTGEATARLVAEERT